MRCVDCIFSVNMIESVSRRAFGTPGTGYILKADHRDKKINTISANITFLDDTQHTFQIDKKAKGSELLEHVFQYLELGEKDYFGLQYTENGVTPDPSNGPITRWLESHKRIRHQAGTVPCFWFGVRFWPEEPSRVESSTARRLLCLQLRKLLRDGRLHAPRPTKLLLASYQAQADLGDWTANGETLNSSDCNIDGIEDLRRVRELHRLHRGQTRSVADLHYLEHARRLDGYGIDAHPAKDSNGKDIAIGVTSQGLVVFQNTIRINTFSWAKIVKISFKRKQFFIQLKREASESYDTVVGFNMGGPRAAKALWRSCVEQHGFHRLQRTPSLTRHITPITRFFIRSPRRKDLDDVKSNGNSFGRGGLARVQESQAVPAPRPAWGYQQQHRSSDDEGGFIERALRVPLGYADASDDEDDEIDDIPISLEPTPTKPPPSPKTRPPMSPLSQVISIHQTSLKPPSLVQVMTINQSEQLSNNGESISSQQSGLVTVTLNPDPAGRYGFNVRGGADLDTPVVVSRVATTPTQQNHSTSHLQEGDQVLAINGIHVEHMRHDQVVQIIRSAKGTLTLTLKPNVDYAYNEEDEPVVQYVPESGVAHFESNGDSSNGNGYQGLGWRQALLLLQDGLGGAAVQQFERLPRRADHTSNIAKSPVNVNKNRYRDIAPYDTTRVVLQNCPSGDYINASHINLDIPNTNIIHKYIAMQGPLSNTIWDTWQMVWESGSTLVIMLGALCERGRPKCHQYWPSLGKTMSGAGLTVHTILEMHDNMAATVNRHISLTQDATGASRTIHQLQYLAWPDHGVPVNPLSFLTLASRASSLRPESAPTVVHCGAGVGRTGALLLMDHATELLRQRKPVYPLDIVKCMRDQRPLCVQNSSQYKFVCECITLAAQAMGLLPSDPQPQGQQDSNI